MLDKNINFNKIKTGSKMENPTHSFREAVFSSCKNRELKVKLMSWSSPKKKECIFCNVNFVRRKFVLSQFIVYGKNFQNIYFLLIRNTILRTLSLLGFKIAESLYFILKDHS